MRAGPLFRFFGGYRELLLIVDSKHSSSRTNPKASFLAGVLITNLDSDDLDLDPKLVFQSSFFFQKML